MSRDVELNIQGFDGARKVLEEWEREDGYYSRMGLSFASEINKGARKYPYVPSPEAKADRMVIKTDVPVDGPINVVYLDGRSDNGLPHTRGNHGIALPVFLLWHPSEKTVRHEIVHISQKQFADRWWNWYSKHWGFRLATEEEFMGIPEKWRLRRRINPDTLGVQYSIWQNRYIPLTVFSSIITPDLRYSKRGFWDIKMTQWTWEPPSGWIAMFGDGFNDEHPHEIIAHWIDGSAGEDKRQYFHLNPI